MRAGRPVVPTDTVYGLCADPHRAEAAERLYELKGRAAKQPTALVAADLETLFKWVPELRGGAILPGPFTLILPNPAKRYPWLTGDRPETIGVRARASWLRTCGARRRRRHGGDERESSGEPDPRTLDEVPAEIREACGALVDGGVAGNAVDGHRPHGARADGPPRGRRPGGGGSSPPRRARLAVRRAKYDLVRGRSAGNTGAAPHRRTHRDRSGDRRASRPGSSGSAARSSSSPPRTSRGRASSKRSGASRRTSTPRLPRQALLRRLRGHRRDRADGDRPRERSSGPSTRLQPHAGAQTNMAVYLAALKPGDTILSLELSHGGPRTA